MSWAVNRETTQVEDRAYNLLGIFGVNIPLLYREGSRAFIRLQEEILKESEDESLLTWGYADVKSEAPTGVLADSPQAFANLSNIVPCSI
jgi:hypothetical protein